MPAVAANGKNKRKRPSSLLAQATSLPSVESSLDDFIARANETLGDANFDAARIAEKELKQEDEKRKEADALRWKATEQQMRESQAREESLRRQLDGLQGKLAEAEARAAVASTGGSQDGVIADLKYRLQSLEDAKRGAEDRSAQLAQELVIAKASQAAAPAAPLASDSFSNADTEELEQRARLAEAKAAKALAAAKAAAAGLTVNPADLAAIESGLVVPVETAKKGTNWGMVFVALLVGGAIAAAAVFVLTKKDNTAKPAASAAPAGEQTQPQAAPPAPAPSKPTVTPIEEPTDTAAAAPAAQPPAAAPATAPEAKPEAKAAAPTETKAAPAEVKAEPAPAEAKAEPAKVEKKAPAKKAAAPAPAKKAAKASKADGGLADPFGGGGETAPAPKKTKPAKAAKKAGGDTGIVDPF
jgi:hypothetical protein